MSVSTYGVTVQQTYRNYRDGAYRVNRMYQRKLVWTLEEKRKLVESILLGYPVPLILLAAHTSSGGSKSYEILDGMQRLNAIFSFIENRFDFNERFFDVRELARAKQLADEGKISAVTDSDRLLGPDQCANLLDYSLAVSEFPASDPAAVNDVFSRINSYGRQLSSQERRQAGVVSGFAKLVRELSAEIRGDVSSDSLDLSEMPSISVESAAHSMGYGIRADETFWCKQGILRRNQLREGEDEQLLADIAVSILEGSPFAFSKAELDAVYEIGSDRAVAVESLLASRGADSLMHGVVQTMSILRETIESVDASANALQRRVHPAAGSNPIKTPFYAVFMAFYQLCIEENRSPSDAKEIMAALDGLHGRLTTLRGSVTSDVRRGNIAVVKGLIQDYFDSRDPPAAAAGAGTAIGFENILRRSAVETANYECKQGILSLDHSRSINNELIDRIAQTVCAIANIGPRSEGAVVIGVADSRSDSEQIKRIDDVEPRQVNGRFVVGVDREARVLEEDLDRYKMRIVESLGAAGLSEPLRSGVLSSIDCLCYRSRSVILIRVPGQSVPSHVNDKAFIREGSRTVELSSFEGTQALAARFAE